MKKTLMLVSTLLVFSVPAHAEPRKQAPFNVTSSEPHQMQLIHQGLAALEKRFQLIDECKGPTLDVEYFIYSKDKAGRLFTQALLKKKKEMPDLPIRVLIDGSETVRQLDPFLIQEMEKAGIQVKIYNDKPLSRAVSTQYRNHRKSLICGDQAITGGRNIADEYFDLSETYNFIDRDVWVKGPIAASMHESFDLYWDNRISTKEKPPEKAVFYSADQEYGFVMESKEYDRKVAAAAEFLTESDADRALLAEVRRLGKEELANERTKGICRDVQFVTDEVGYDFLRNAVSEKRHVRDALLDKFDQAKKGDHIFMESPYFIIKKKGTEVYENLVQKGVTATALTNSLGSTDAFYVAAIFNTRAHRYASEKHQIKFYVHGGKAPKETLYAKDKSGKELSRDAVWGIHAKSIVFTDKSFSIGTFNIDPRSANLNTEELLFCNDGPELAANVIESIQSRVAMSYELDDHGIPKSDCDCVTPLSGASGDKVLKYFLSLLPAQLLDWLM